MFSQAGRQTEAITLRVRCENWASGPIYPSYGSIDFEKGGEISDDGHEGAILHL